MSNDQKLRKWLTIIGIGDNGFESLSSEAQKICDSADTLFAAERHLQGMPKLQADIQIWESPFQKAIQKMLAWREHGLKGKNAVILATGDPMHFGIGATLTQQIDIAELQIIPSPSAFSLAAARLGWPLRNVTCMSVHGRSLSLLHKAVLPNNRIITLTSNSQTIDDIADLLVDRGFGQSKLTVLEHMGGDKQHIIHATANDWQIGAAANFNTLAIECIAEQYADIIPNIAGLDDSHYLHDGQLTKSDIRAATVNKLLPSPNSIMWDLGAGNGSVGIEYMRLAKGSICHAVEKSETRLQNIKMNANNLGVPDIKTHLGCIDDFIKTLPKPDAVFIGGGLTENLFNALYDIIPIGGRIVINVVTLEGIGTLNQIYHRFKDNFTQTKQITMLELSTANLVLIGQLNAFKPNLKVTQLSLIKVATQNDG